MSVERYRVPSTRSLVAFECVARLQGVGRAAAALNTSQSAISRHLRQLEDDLGVALFERRGRGLALTIAGRTYLAAVAPALESLNAARQEIGLIGRDVTIACTHEVSHLVLMPRFQRLRQALGGTADIRILTCEYEVISAMVDAGADLLFEYAPSPPDGPCVEVQTEEIVPVAAADFIADHADALAASPRAWAGIPRLALSKPNLGWATWEDWFAAFDAKPPEAPGETFDNYVYLLEAAAAGGGLAIGWKGFVDRYLQAGTLVTVGETWQRCPRSLFARLTDKGTRNRNAAACLSLLSDICSVDP